MNTKTEISPEARECAKGLSLWNPEWNSHALTIAGDEIQQAIDKANHTLTTELTIYDNLYKELQEENARLKAWIEHDGDVTNTCTFEILGKVCNRCQCPRSKKTSPNNPTS